MRANLHNSPRLGRVQRKCCHSTIARPLDEDDPPPTVCTVALSCPQLCALLARASVVAFGPCGRGGGLTSAGDEREIAEEGDLWVMPVRLAADDRRVTLASRHPEAILYYCHLRREAVDRQPHGAAIRHDTTRRHLLTASARQGVSSTMHAFGLHAVVR